MRDNRNTVGSGAGCLIVIFLILLILQLTGVINVSWWIVSMPLWFPIALVFTVFLIGLLIVAATAAFAFIVGFLQDKNE